MAILQAYSPAGVRVLCFTEGLEPCTDPRELNHTSWETMPGISVLQIDGEGTIEGSAGAALRGSPSKWLRVPAKHPPFSVRVRLTAEPCPLWEIISFQVIVQGAYSFYVTIGDQTSDTVQVCPIFVTLIAQHGNEMRLTV